MNQLRLKWSHTYHIYNRGNNRGQIFFELENYEYFMRLYKKYVANLADLYAYCLLPNHYHLLLRIDDRNNHVRIKETKISEKFGTFLGTYVKAINNKYQRTGSLFEGRYQRKLIGSENPLITTLIYIHQNPQIHGYFLDFKSWPYSSYSNYLERNPEKILSSSIINDPFVYDSIMELHKTDIQDAGS